MLTIKAGLDTTACKYLALHVIVILTRPRGGNALFVINNGFRDYSSHPNKIAGMVLRWFEDEEK